MPDYTNAKIYKIWSPHGEEIYIGSTTQRLYKRLNHHKCARDCSSKILFENYDDVRIELIENFPCNNKEELNKKEGEYIRNNDCINKVIAGRTQKEYREDNKEKMKEYCEDNKEKIKEQRKEYRENNKEKIREYTENNKEKRKEYYENNKQKYKDYREDNKAKITEYQKDYRENNKELLYQKKKDYYDINKQIISEKKKEQYTCQCGRIIRISDKARHERSNFHQLAIGGADAGDALTSAMACWT